jgi:hypothetical protein
MSDQFLALADQHHSDGASFMVSVLSRSYGVTPNEYSSDINLEIGQMVI